MNNKIIFLEIPKVCPYCGKPTEIRKDNNSEVLFCPNEQCESRLINKLEHFCGKKGLDIKGISKATFQKLIDWGWINSLSDIFLLKDHREEWIKKPGFGVKSVDKILSSIEEKQNKVSLESFISAIGIPLIGDVAAKEIAKHFKTYEEFKSAVQDEKYIFDYPYFGVEMNNNLKIFDYSEADEISSKFIKIDNNQSTAEIQKSNDKLKDKVIVITGKLSIVKNRAELVDKIQSCGGKVSNSVSKKTNILINNDTTSTSSKNLAAQKLNIPIMSEKEFIEKFLDN